MAAKPEQQEQEQKANGDVKGQLQTQPALLQSQLEKTPKHLKEIFHYITEITEPTTHELQPTTPH